MEIKDLVSAIATVCFIAGIFMSSFLPLVAFVLLVIALILVIVWIVLKKKNVTGDLSLK